MSSTWLARGRMVLVPAVALALLSGLYACSNVVDPSTGQLHGKASADMAATGKQPAQEAQTAAADPAANAAAAAEVDRLKRENQQLKVQQQENQARMDALTKQMAQEREEQRRFREMMATNFDLLEQSVSKSLGDQMQRNQTAQAKTPPAAAKAPVAGPAAVPPPAGEMAPAQVGQPQAAQGPAASGPAALEPMPYWDEKTPATGKSGPAPSAKFEAKKPNDGMAKPGDMTANQPDKSKSAMTAAPAGAAASHNGGNGKAGHAAPPADSAGKTGPAKSAKADGQELDAKNAAVPLAATAAVAGAASKPATFNDPDLQPPAHPRELAANAEAKPMYEKGFVYFAKGDYEDSIKIYKDFLARFPNDAYSDNAQFWIGEAHLQLKQVDQADNAFRQVLRNYAHKSTLEGYKTPDAIYKLGQISLIRNDRPRAEYYFGNVSERFPESTAGQRAQKELDSIRVNTAASGKLSPDT